MGKNADDSKDSRVSQCHPFANAHQTLMRSYALDTFHEAVDRHYPKVRLPSQYTLQPRLTDIERDSRETYNRVSAQQNDHDFDRR